MSRHQITTTNLKDYVGREIIIRDEESLSEQKITLKGWEEGKIAGFNRSNRSLVYLYPGGKEKLFVEL